MSTVWVLLTLLSACVFAIGGNGLEPSPARYTAKIVDEDENPLAGVNVLGGFYTEEPRLSGLTDSNGIFVLECKKAMSGEAGFSVCHDLPGYYETHSGYVLKKIVDGRWEPWNPVVTTVVRRVVNPIPMYAKKVETTIPVTDSLCCYDLMIGDWLAPYGKGTSSDLIFEFNRRVTNPQDYVERVNLTFTNRFDGIVETKNLLPGSVFRFARYAYESGYRATYAYSRGVDPKTGRFGEFNPENEAYLIRVRSVLDESGKLKEALYGKVIGGIDLAGVGTQSFRVSFTYYLNPTPNDRNMEFDPKQNLLKDLKFTEPVTTP